MSSPSSVTDIARATLLRLSELGLPPTPENYTRFYIEISGEPRESAPTATHSTSAKIMRMVRALVDTVAERTAHLASDLGERNRDMRHTIDSLNIAREKVLVLQLAEELVAKADSIHETVEDTHKDLEATRLAFEHMSAEITETRQSLLEDALTGAQNRRGMDAILGREVARAKRNQNRLVIAMIDVDHFKRVNDSYGHDAGDKLLMHLSIITKSVLRESDALVRYGGEEFLLILPDADLSGAEFVVNRLRKVIAKSHFRYEQKLVEITVSAGLARLRDGENGQSLVLRADQALYEAKQAGRDCVRVVV